MIARHACVRFTNRPYGEARIREHASVGLLRLDTFGADGSLGPAHEQGAFHAY